jgi:hypothetical protein
MPERLDSFEFLVLSFELGFYQLISWPNLEKAGENNMVSLQC